MISLIDTTVQASGEPVYTLPSREEGWHAEDAQGYSQIVVQNLPSLNLSVGSPGIVTPVLVSARHGLVEPGLIAERERDDGGVQYVFAQHEVFLVDDQVTIYFEPTGQAGTEIIEIEVPGLPVQEFELEIDPAGAEVIELDLPANVAPSAGGVSCGCSVTDSRGNVIEDDIAIEIETQ